MEYLTVKKLQQRFGLSWMDAERILKEQTGQAYYRHPLPVACWFAAFAACFGLPLLLPDGRGWNVAAKAAAVVLMLSVPIMARLAKHDDILEAGRKLTKPQTA